MKTCAGGFERKRRVWAWLKRPEELQELMK